MHLSVEDFAKLGSNSTYLVSTDYRTCVQSTDCGKAAASRLNEDECNLNFDGLLGRFHAGGILSRS
jgi:hypothetical protein